MLKEQSSKQTGSEHIRRWLSDDYLDLIVWQEPNGDFYGFQLCYDKPGKERALTWTTKSGFSHRAVDDGESSPEANCTPILVDDGGFPVALVRRQFSVRAYGIDPRIQDFVLTKIDEYAALHG